MASVVYALFADGARATEAELALRKDQPKGAPRVAQLHRRAPLPGNELPEPATEFGRNLLLAMVGGAGFMAAAGGIAGALNLMLGMGVALGIGLGALTGTLMGLVGAMQAGTRHAKQALVDLQPRIQAGAVLLLIEVPGRDVELTMERLEPFAPELLDALGEW